MLGIAPATLAFMAGIASILSPCVLPLLPIILASTLNGQRIGALWLATGLATSFALSASLLAWFGLQLVFLRPLAAWFMLGWGILMLSSPLQHRFAWASAPIGQLAASWLSRLSPTSTGAPFLTGFLLGSVWTPCVGPTLGAVAILASQQQQPGLVSAMSLLFGLGAALPLVFFGKLSALATKRHWLRIGLWGKTALGGLMLALALVILLGWDKPLEALLLRNSPDWIVKLSISY